MTDDKGCPTGNQINDYRLSFSGCDDVSAELLRFFDAIQEATRNVRKRENASLKRWKPQVRIFTTHALRPPTPIVSNILPVHGGANSCSGKTIKHEETE